MTDEGYELMGPAHGPLAPPAIGPPVIAGQKPTVAPPTAPPLAVVLEKKHAMEKAAAAAAKKKNRREDSESESVAEATGKSVKARSSLMSVMTEPGEESRMESAEVFDGTAIVQRPNSLDICQLATVILLTIIVCVIAIIVGLAATGKADIDWINNKLMQPKKP